MTAAVLPGLLAGVALALALARPSPSRRLRAVLPRPAPVVTASGLQSHRLRLLALLAGTACWLVVGGTPGVVLGLGAVVGVPRLLARLERPPDDTEEVEAALPLALDLLAACLSGGAPPTAALTAVAEALQGPCADRFRRVASALAVGAPPEEAWHALGEGRGAAGAAARTLARAAEGGAPVAAAVHRVAEDARREDRARAERAARRAGVLAVGPLGLCFLPAFLLLGVVPAVIGLALPVLDSL